ncbi:hypothetical protein F4554_004878 [Actinopolymorpha rutila]|uniref:Uncharacterized protein n=1 Tax=Actinopolymorpha rutila TaxID=446787 RepID=A0A852ZTB4_9ACTN|nr:hypothetical protein [Actinopolymorpha rutila]
MWVIELLPLVPVTAITVRSATVLAERTGHRGGRGSGVGHHDVGIGVGRPDHGDRSGCTCLGDVLGPLLGTPPGRDEDGSRCETPGVLLHVGHDAVEVDGSYDRELAAQPRQNLFENCHSHLLGRALTDRAIRDG